MNPSWVETQELLTATFEQPVGERERFVREHCVDPALRDTIAALVKPVPTTQSTRSAHEPELPPGALVGPYVVLHRLGRGGMGEVFLGRDPRLDRSVALKCLLSSRGGSDDLRAHVIQEARAAARITHAHVAAVYDVLEHDGRAFIVMEYVEGESLAALLQRGPLPPDRVVAIGRQIADALGAAHGGGIVHRDLKPANIQVTLEGSIKILDFGIAKARALTTRSGAPGIAETRGFQAGTPAYMAPEQLLGRGADERSDLFSLASILFEMATGRRLFASNDPLTVLMAAMGALPRADSIDSRVPSPLADIIATGLAADPEDRFQSANEFKAALDGVREELFATSTGHAVRTAASPARFNRMWAWGGLVAAVPLLLWALGRLSSAAFNTTLGRVGTFAAEGPLDHFIIGAKSLVAPCVYAGLAMAALWTGKFVLRLADLSANARRIRATAAVKWHLLVNRLNLNDPTVLAQALAALGTAAVALVAWRFNLLIRAWGVSISVAPNELIWRLGDANEGEKVLYRAVLTLLFFAFAAGLIRVIKLRVAQRVRRGTASFAGLVIVVTSLLLLIEAPYRILWRNESRRVDYQGSRCYVIGEDAARWLLFCPEKGPPRNRVVARTDPAVRESGEIENIFTFTPPH
jgi:hypothetical protein